MLHKLFRMEAHDLGIDLGTANTLIYVRGKGVVLNEPSIIAKDKRSGKITAVGEDARRLIGRTPPHIEVIRPMKDGVIADYATTKAMLKHYLARIVKRRPWKLHYAIIGVPLGATSVEKRAVIEAGMEAGLREVYLIDEPMAAAIGAGLPVSGSKGVMVVDIGGGTTDVAVIALGGIVVGKSLRCAGDKMNEAIAAHVRRRHKLLIGINAAEQAKIEIGSACAFADERGTTLKGRDQVTGLPKMIDVSAEEIRYALREPVHMIAEAIKAVLDKTPPELVSDIIDNGIVLTGGGSLIYGLDLMLAEETHVDVCVAQDALACVAIGAGRVVDDFGKTRMRDKCDKDMQVRISYKEPKAPNIRRERRKKERENDMF